MITLCICTQCNEECEPCTMRELDPGPSGPAGGVAQGFLTYEESLCCAAAVEWKEFPKEEQ